MNCKSNEELDVLIKDVKPYVGKGKVANYIPALAKVDPLTFGVAVHYLDDHCVYAGQADYKFTLQSISKILTLALAIMDCGQECVFDKVGKEPTGDPFNSIAKLESLQPSKPLNPMINAGALAVTSLIHGTSNNEKFERILELIRKLSGNSEITYSKEVAASELESAHLNRALCYFMKSHGIISSPVEELLELYTKQCAIEVTCRDLARIGSVIANEGRDLITGEQHLTKEVSRLVKTFMVTCGMYNESGAFAIEVGIPAKSGVSGGILATIPGKLGIGVYSPALNEKGNSVAGVQVLKVLSSRYNLSMF